MTFNLPTPSNFRGLDENRPVRFYERHMPHWRQDGATYFVTFSLADAMPANKQLEIESLKRDWEHRHPPPRTERYWLDYAKSVYDLSEKALDVGFGRCWFRNTSYIEEIKRSLLHFHRQRYELGCYVIMANHCHLVMRPFDDIELEDELGAIKRATSRFVNQREGLTGPLWTQECYDRIIRDEEHLYRVIQYIGNNPAKAGLPEAQWQRWINPEWEKVGWKFDDACSRSVESQ